MTLNDEDVPAGWKILWCATCLSSIAWTDEDLTSYGNEWAIATAEAVDMAEHDRVLHLPLGAFRED